MNQKTRTLLLTNDDGYLSDGLQALRARLAVDHEVWVVAPDGERSACSHSITSGGGPLVTRQVEDRVFSCSGTPADCVNLALADLMPHSPDLVLSGINHGPNAGTDVLFSGTAAGARQASLKDIPGVALSIQSYQRPFHFQPAVEFVAQNVETILAIIPSGEFLNINFPNLPTAEIRLKTASLGNTVYRDHRSAYDANGKRYHFWSGGLVRDSAEADLAAVLDGYTTLTLVKVMPAEGGTVGLETFRVPPGSARAE